MNDSPMDVHLGLAMTARVHQKWSHEQNISCTTVNRNSIARRLFALLISSMRAGDHSKRTINGGHVVQVDADGKHVVEKFEWGQHMRQASLSCRLLEDTQAAMS